MATRKQAQAAKRNAKNARAGAQKKRTVANLSTKTRARPWANRVPWWPSASAPAAQHRRPARSSAPKPKRRHLPGRSKTGRDEPARALGHH